MALTKTPIELSSTPSIVDGGNATAITIDSSEKVGIGDTSPFAKLHVEDTGWSSGAPYGTVAYIQGGATNDANWGHLLLSQSGTTTDTGGRLAFGANGENPIAGIRAKYKGATYGDLAFSTRPSGGTNTERLVIDSSGNVGINNTDPDYSLHISGTIGDQAPLQLLTVTGTPSASFNWVTEAMSANLGQDKRIVHAFGISRGNGLAGTMSFVPRASSGDNAIAFGLFGKNDIFNITYNGFCGVGTTVPTAPLQVAGQVRWNTTTGDGFENRMFFNPGGASDDPHFILYRHDGSSVSSEIRPGNYVKFENSLYLTNSAARIGMMGADPSSDISCQTGTNGNTTVMWRWGGNGSNTSAYFINNSNAGVAMGSGDTSWSSHSDERLKENITDIGSTLNKIKDYRCIEYNRKGSTRKMYGFIAQEWEPDFPYCVDDDTGFTIQSDGTLLGANEEGNISTDNPKSIKYTETIPVLLKAIQELKEENDALKARVTTLEG